MKDSLDPIKRKLVDAKSRSFSWSKQVDKAEKMKIRHDKWKVKQDPNFVAKVGKRQASRIEDGVI